MRRLERPSVFGTSNSLCTRPFLRSQSIRSTLFSACANEIARFADTKLLPSLALVEVTKIVLRLLSIAVNCKLVLRLLIFSLTIAFGYFSTTSSETGAPFLAGLESLLEILPVIGKP